MLADPAGGCACATRSSSNPKAVLARSVPPVTTPPSEGSNVAGSPNLTFIWGVLFDLALFIFICAICVDLDRPRLFAALVI